MNPNMSIADINAKYGVNIPSTWEAVSWILYDYQAYAAAGQPTLSFFQTPYGQRTGGLSDTNMALAGQLSKNNAFLVQAIEIPFWPTVPAVAANNPAVYGAGADPAQVNDVYLVSRTGNLTFTINNKQYMQDGPLGQFPTKRNLEINAAFSDASTAAASQATRVAYAYFGGEQRDLGDYPLYLDASQQFGVSLNWPEGVQAITNPARIGVRLLGTLFRTAQ